MFWRNKKPKELPVPVVREKPTLFEHINAISVVDVAGELLDCYGAWVGSRQWARVLFLLPGLAVLITVTVVFLIGYRVSGQQIRTQYVKLADEELERISEQNALRTTSMETSEFVTNDDTLHSDSLDVYFKRILQIESNNKLAQYYVATKLAAAGRPSDARRIISELAPRNQDGLDRAHEWMARDMMEQTVRSGKPIDGAALRHHLHSRCDPFQCQQRNFDPLFTTCSFRRPRSRSCGVFESSGQTRAKGVATTRQFVHAKQFEEPGSPNRRLVDFQV